MKKTLLKAEPSNVETLGLKIKLKPGDKLELLVNGVDILDNVDFESLEVNILNEGEEVAS